MQFDYARFDLLSLEIWSHKFDHARFDYLSCETYAKLSTGAKSVLTFDHCHLHSVTFGYY